MSHNELELALEELFELADDLSQPTDFGLACVTLQRKWV